MECACEEIALGAATDYAWDKWPDKRVVPVKFRFFLSC
jgi:hypothetical protein